MSVSWIEVECVTFVVLIVLCVLSVMLLIADIVTIPIILTSSNCLKYRDYYGGAGDIFFCVLHPEDDNVVISFDKKKDNVAHSDSTAYLLSTPLDMYRTTNAYSYSFDNKNFRRYHNLFPGDSIIGDVECKDSCNLRVVQVTNRCMIHWDYSVYNFTNVGISNAGIVGSSGSKCKYHSNVLAEQEIGGSGTIHFVAETTAEGPTYVSVGKSAFKSPTGVIKYSLHHSVFNTSKALQSCNSYKCTFDGLTGNGRTDTYVAVNVFSDNMEGTYEMDIDYHPSKKAMELTSIGLAAAFGGLLLITGICALFYWYSYKMMIDEKVSSSSTTSNTSSNTTNNNTTSDTTTPGLHDNPLFSKNEIEMEDPTFVE